MSATRSFRSVALPGLLPGLLLAAVGCADSAPGEETPTDLTAPGLVVTSPDRGTISGEVQSVTVRGTATDEMGIASVTVNGIPAAVAADGSFEATVDIFPGTNLLRTIAYDAAGNTATDTRSTLAGAMQSNSMPLPDSVLVTMSADTFGAIGEATSNMVEEADLLAAIAAGNPVIDKGRPNGEDCLFVYANINEFLLSSADIQLAPAPGGLWLTADLTDLYAQFDGHYKVACIRGNDDLFVSADGVTITGFLSTQVENKQFALTLQNADVQFDNLEIDATGFPGAILDIVDFFASFENIIRNMVIDNVVPMVDDALAGLSQTKSTTVMGKTINFAVAPSIINFDAAGATVQLDTSIDVVGSENGPGFVYTTNQVPNLDHAQGFNVGLADDVLNQLLAGFWAAGGMTQTLDLTTGDYGPLGALYDTIEIAALLPPTVDAHGDGGMMLNIGDLMATFYLDGQMVTKIAINGSVDVGAGLEGGNLALVLGTPAVDVDIDDEGVVGGNALSAEAFEELISFAAERLVGSSGSLLGELPMPTLGGMQFQGVGIGGVNGYLLVEGALGQ